MEVLVRSKISEICGGSCRVSATGCYGSCKESGRISETHCTVIDIVVPIGEDVKVSIVKQVAFVEEVKELVPLDLTGEREW